MNPTKVIELFRCNPRRSATVLVTDVRQFSRNTFGKGWTKGYGFVDLQTNIIKSTPRVALENLMWIEAVLTLEPGTTNPVVSQINKIVDVWDTAYERDGEGGTNITISGRWGFPGNPIKHGPVRYYHDRILGHVFTQQWFPRESSVRVDMAMMENPLRIGNHSYSCWIVKNAVEIDDLEDDEDDFLRGYMG